MAKIKPTHADAKEIFSGFDGICFADPLSGKGASDMCNFRMHADKSLSPRSGYRKLADFGGREVRGVWEGSFEGDSLIWVAAGDRVYTVNTEGITTVSQRGRLPTSTGRVTFLPFENDLYLIDGNTLRVYRQSDRSFIEVEAYVPLMGENWAPVGFGDILEEPNILTDRLRFNFKNIGGSTVFYIPYYADGVVSVYLNGRETTDYTFDESYSNRITIPSASVASSIDVTFRISLFADTRASILSSSVGYVHTGTGHQTMFLRGGRYDHRLFPSRKVTTDMLSRCRVAFPLVKPLYFRSDEMLSPGNEDHPVTAMIPHYEGILAMSDTHTWRLEFTETGKLSCRSVLDGAGCPSCNAVCSYDGGIAMIAKGSLKHLETLISRPEYPTVKNIPLPPGLSISSTMQTDGLLLWNPEWEELWLRDPKDTTSSVWVYNPTCKAWYRYDNIPATQLFSISNGVGFATKNGYLYVFENTLCEDEQQPFTCRYQSTYMDMGMPETPRRSLRMSLCADLGGGTASVEVLRERDGHTYTFQGCRNGGVEHFDVRLPTKRYRFLRFSVSLTSEEVMHLYKISFFARI